MFIIYLLCMCIQLLFEQMFNKKKTIIEKYKHYLVKEKKTTIVSSGLRGISEQSDRLEKFLISWKP